MLMANDKIKTGEAEKEGGDKRLDLALDRLHGKISNLQDRVNKFSRELQE